MRFITKFSFFLLLFGILTSQANAASFIVKDIRFEGLQGISRDTAISYMPVQIGQRFDSSQTDEIIKNLYATGFFSDISISQDGDVLVVKVAERPVIGSIVVTGNKDIPKDKLDEVLKGLGLAQGRVFNQSTLDEVQKSLQNQYDVVGKYSARVNTSVTPQSHNRVAVRIDISEGLTVQIADIHIIGNHAFGEKKLIRAMPIATHHLWSFYTEEDKYSSEKLDKATEALRSYYLDRGYLKFQIDSTQVTLTPDRKQAYIVFHITEGPIYTVKGYNLTGNLILSQTKLQSLIKIKPGDVFSRKVVQDAGTAIGRALGDMGYAFASVNAMPTIDEQAKTVFITFYIDPGNRVYVRRINFSGNIKTQDVVFRRLIRQLEGGLVSVDDIKESERLLNISGYLEKDVKVETAPVPGVPDEVDLNFNVKEAPAAQATFGVGYGTNGVTLAASLNQNNFLGTGNALSINFNTSLLYTIYNISYTNPYYTPDGIARGFSVFYQHSTPYNLNIAQYSMNTYGGTLNYSIPLDVKGDNLLLGIGLQKTQIFVGGGVSQEVNQFLITNGSNFQQASFSVGWSRNGLDQAFFPTTGLYQDAAIQVVTPVGGNPLDYYKGNYNIRGYYPLGKGFIIQGRAAAGYGNGFGPTHGLPFFANYYAGGVGYVGQVRGYEANTLGPLDSNGNALGGNIMTVGSIGLIFPTPLTSDRLRTTAFVDAGNVFTTLGVSTPGNPRGGTPAGPLRYSAGVAIDWRVPVFNALLSISVAKAINPQPTDQTNIFQFSVGTSF